MRCEGDAYRGGSTVNLLRRGIRIDDVVCDRFTSDVSLGRPVVAMSCRTGVPVSEST